jgi:hypothetical protein
MDQLIILFLAAGWCGVPSFHGVKAKQVDACRAAVVACQSKPDQLQACILGIKFGKKDD